MKRTLVIILKSFAWIIGLILILLILIIGAIQLPAVQTWLVGKVTSYVSDKTHTRIEIKKLGISFPKTIVLEGLYAEDIQHDTLISLGSLRVDVDMLALLRKEVQVNSLELQDAYATISRSLPDSSFNFDFIIKAFSSGDTTTKPVADTASSPWKIGVETIELERVRFTFRDDVSGMLLKTDVGSMQLHMDEMDLSQMKFYVDELAVKNTKGLFEITAAIPETPDTTASGPLPDISLNRISLNNVDFGFHNKPDSSFFDFIVGNMQAKPKKIDLNKQKIELATVLMEQCDVAIAMKQNASEDPETADTASSENNWQASVSEFKMNNNRFRFNITNVPVAKKGIDYKHLDASAITLYLRNASYSPSLIKGDLKHLSLNERCGLSVKKMRTRFVYDDKHAELANLFIATPNTTISNYLSASYPSISSIGENPGELGVGANMKNTRVYLEDVLYFVPDLTKQAPFSSPKQHISIDGKITGKLKDLTLEKIIVQAGNKTALAMDAHIKGLPDAANAYYDIDLKTLTTTETDLKKLLPDSTIPSSIHVPQQLMLHGVFTGTLANLETYLSLQTNQGAAEVTGAMKTIDKIPYYEADLKTKDLDIGYILGQQPTLGKLSLSIDVSGHSLDSNMSATLKGKILSAYINKYRYTNIPVIASVDSGKYAANISVRDTNIVMDLDAKLCMKNGQEYITASINLDGADLYALHLTRSDLKVAGGMRADIKSFSFDNMTGYVGIGNVILVKNKQKYVIDSLVAMTVNKKRNSSFTVNNSIIQVNYQGATGLHEIGSVLQDHFYQYTGRKTVKTDTVTQNFTCKIAIKPNRIFKEVFIPELKQFSGLDINSSFNGPENQFVLDARSDLIVYGDNRLQNFNASVKSNNKELRYEVTLASLSSGNIRLPKTSLEGNVANNNLFFALRVNHPDTGVKLLVSGNVDMQKENVTQIRFAEGRIVLNNENWKIPAGNQINIHKEGLNIQQFELSNKDQLIRAQSANTLPNAPISVQFRSFELGTLSQIIENDTSFVRGMLNGDVNIKSLQPFAFTSDLGITNVSYTDIPVGDLKVKADNLTASRYTASVTLSGNNNQAAVNGYYQENDIHFKVNIRQLNLATFDAFTGGQLSQSRGYLTGNISIDGKASAPAFNGSLTFKDATTRVALINNRIHMQDETIRIDEKGVYFNKFTVRDSTGQPLVIDGDIQTTNFVNMDFNLDIRTQKFRVLNTTARDNKIYYGTLLLNSRIRVRGNELLPVINANVSLIEGSEFTFVVQEGELNTSRGEDVVIFIDTSSNTILSRQDSGMVIASQFKGIDFTANIQVNKDTRFRIIVDKNSGDKLEVSGDAILSFGIDPSGKMSLTGTYTLNDGSYRASYYSVERNFLIKKGSSITWTGDPLDGLIDITAIYRQSAPAADLLSVELSGMSPNERNAYRKPLTFDVNLIIQGSISKPQPSFQLDMAEKDRNAFGGMVYSKIGQINTNPNELNKQVFALLILEHFLPQSGLGGGGGDPTTTIARNSVNQLLSDQLNNLSGKYIKGAELNFNLQSDDNYTNAGTVEQNTQLQVMLKKELFNSRVTVQVGSSVNIQGQQPVTQQNAQNLTGDVVVEYKITEDGRYRFKAFRENNYEGIIDGLLYKTGIGVLYTRDYDKFSELLSAPKKEEEEQENNKEKEKKQEEKEKQPAKKEEKAD